MYLGENATLTYVVSSASAFTVTSPLISIQDTSGAVVASGTPTVSPGGSSTSQTLSFGFMPGSVGVYTIKWTVTVGSEVKEFPDRVEVFTPSPGRNYPQASDLQAFLESHGFVLTAAQISQLGPAIQASIAEFERQAGRKMLAGAETTEHFYPPEQGNTLLIRDLAAPPSSVIYTPFNGSPTTWTLGTNYDLQPADASTRPIPIPYSALRLRTWWGWNGCSSQSIAITGRWGYSIDLPADVWEGMVAGGALRMGAALSFSLTGGLRSWTEANTTENYGDGPVAGLTSFWQTQFEAWKRYRNWTL